MTFLFFQVPTQYTYKRSEKRVAASLQGYSRCNLSSEESQNVLTLVSFTNNRGSAIDLRHFLH